MVLFLVTTWQSIVALVQSCWYNFDGVNEYVDCGNDSSLSFTSTDAFSISCWFNMDVTNNKAIWSKYDSVGVRGIYLRHIDSTGLLLQFASTSSNSFSIKTNTALNADQWYNAVYVYDGSGSVNGLSLYVDGVFQTRIVHVNTFTPGSDITTTNPFNMGNFGTSGTITLDGDMDEVSIWDTELSQANITAIYDKGRTEVDYTDVIVPPTNLISHWKMGEDDTFNEYLTFDAVNEDVTVAHDASIDFDKNDAFSISVWVNLDTLSIYQEIVSKQLRTGNYDGYFFRINNNNTLQFLMQGDAAGANRIDISTSTTLSNTNQWYHIILTKSTSALASGISIYVDGASQAMAAALNNNLTTNTLTTQPLSIGSRDSTDLYLDGKMDKIIIYDKELTSREVTEIYRYGRKAGLIGIGNEVSQWEMGEDGVFYDYLTFDGVNERITVGSFPSPINLGVTHSASVWATIDELGHFILHTNSNPNMYMFYFAGTSVYVNRGGDLKGWSFVPTLGQWYHFVYTRGNSTSGTMYVDGVSLGSQTFTSNVDHKINLIGSNTAGDDLWKGKISKTILYDKELSQTEVTTIYNYDKTTGLIGIGNEVHQWEMDNATTVTDVIGSVDGITANMTSTNLIEEWSVDDTIKRYWTEFDGVNEFVSVPHDSTIDFDKNSAFSFSIWVNSTSTGYGMIYSKYDDSLNIGIRISKFTANEIDFYLRDGGTFRRIRSTTTLINGVWYEIICTNDTSDTIGGMNLYINGVLDKNTITDTLVTTISNTYDLRIGGDAAAFFQGKLDKGVIYNDVITSGEVTTIYNYGRKSGLIGIGNEVSQWEMDALNPTDIVGSNNGTSTNQDSTNLINDDNSGISVNMASTNLLGEWNVEDTLKRYWTTFDGVNESINMGNVLDKSNTDTFSFSAWINTDVTTVTYVMSKALDSGTYRGYNALLLNGNLRVILRNTNTTNQLFVDSSTTTMVVNTWYHVAFTYDGNNDEAGLKLYIDGLIQGKTITTNNLSATLSTSENFRLGARGSSFEMDGEMDEVAMFSSELSQTDITTIYNKGRNNPSYSGVTGIESHWAMDELSPNDKIGSNNGTAVNMDSTNIKNDDNSGVSVNMDTTNRICEQVVAVISDADAFITAAGITDLTQKGAIRTLVSDLKANNLWDNMVTIYPMVGGTAAAHKFNLKNPLDTDGAFRLTFAGGWTHSSTGALPDGSTGYANTHIVPSSDLITNDVAVSYYSRTDSAGNVEFGATNGPTSLFQGRIKGSSSSNPILFDCYSSTGGRILGGSNTVSNNFHIYSRRSATDSEVYIDGVSAITDNSGGGSAPAIDVYVGARNNAGTLDAFDDKEVAFITFGEGLSDTEATNLHTVVTTFNTLLNRQN